MTRRKKKDTCQRCGAALVLFASAKASDGHYFALNGEEYNGYGLDGLNMGVDDDYGFDEDYLSFRVCLDCGQMQGSWPSERRSLPMERRR